MPRSQRPREQRKTGGYTKQPNDFISAKECVLIVDHRVSVLLAHWEDQRRQREAARRPVVRLKRWLALGAALLRPPAPVTAPTDTEEVVG